MTKCQIEELEVIDRMLVRHTLNAHSKTALEWMYSNTGRYNLKSLIQIGRFIYLWQILSRNNDELIHRLYHTKKNSSSVGDWVRLLEADKHELGIDMTDEEIQGASQELL